MERTNFTFISLPHWLKAAAMLFVFGWMGTPQASAQGPCANDQWAPIIVYPSQDIVVNLDPCGINQAIVFFEVTVTDDCDGDHFAAAPGDPVTPGSEFTVTAFNGPDFTTIFSAGGDRFMGVFEPGTYQVQISAEDAAGNFRDEDFLVTVLQGTPPPTNLICNYQVNATLNDDCQRFISADMVLEGDFGCAQESDFRVSIVTDDDPTNGNILDGHGQFIYEVTYVGPLLTGPSQGGAQQTVTFNGFGSGPFAAANWTVEEVIGSGGAGAIADVSFTATTLTIQTLTTDYALASIVIPQDGNLSFSWNYNGADPNFDFFIFDLNNANIVTQTNAASGSFNQPVEAGWVLLFQVDDDDLLPIGTATPSTATITNFVFSTLGDVDPNAPSFPFFNWEDCWGYINGEDKAGPDLDCPGDTDEGTTILDCFTQTGTLEDGDLEMEPLNFSCFIDGGGTTSSLDPGVHYYDLIPFQVDRTDYYTILVSDDFGSTIDESAIAIFQGGFNPSNPCENIIAFQDEPISDVTPPLANDETYIRISLPLIAGETYYLWVAADDDISGPAGSGDYTVDICPDENGRVGLFSSTTVLNPQTWEPMVINTTVLWPRRDVSLTLPLFCEDFDLIFNNPASLDVTGRPVVSDNCDNSVSVSFVDTYSSAGDCAPIVITRRFTATDDKGNSTSCTQLITLNRPTDLDVEFPPRTVPIECDEQFATLPNGNPHPSHTGYPFIVTVSGIFNLADDYCNIGASFVDRARVNVCEGAFKFVRDWTVIDWCDGDNIATDAQVIKVGDYTPPSVTCPGQDYDWDGDLDPLVFSVSPFGCTASFSVPLPDVTDNCSDWEVRTEIVTEVEVDVVNQYGQVTGTRTDTVVVRVIPWNAPTRLVSGIPAGEHYFRYTVEDGCGNKVIKYCPFSVRDLVEPTAICDDDLTVSIGGADLARIYAEDIDEGSNDNCGEVSLAVRRTGVVLDQFGRVIPFICGNQVSPWGPFVDFYCCDVGRTITIELRVRDNDGGENICWLDIVPEEKVKP
ncbi:MAG: hypothetical protein J5I98_05940, partial [Phaeodactylibacter sp.]|nr:hypothetical protein [Phaeodactylibacter sp.]